MCITILWGKATQWKRKVPRIADSGGSRAELGKVELKQGLNYN